MMSKTREQKKRYGIKRELSRPFCKPSPVRAALLSARAWNAPPHGVSRLCGVCPPRGACHCVDAYAARVRHALRGVARGEPHTAPIRRHARRPHEGDGEVRVGCRRPGRVDGLETGRVNASTGTTPP